MPKSSTSPPSEVEAGSSCLPSEITVHTVTTNGKGMERESETEVHTTLMPQQRCCRLEIKTITGITPLGTDDIQVEFCDNKGVRFKITESIELDRDEIFTNLCHHVWKHHPECRRKLPPDWDIPQNGQIFELNDGGTRCVVLYRHGVQSYHVYWPRAPTFKTILSLEAFNTLMTPIVPRLNHMEVHVNKDIISLCRIGISHETCVVPFSIAPSNVICWSFGPN
jgi:hypothetical protein